MISIILSIFVIYHYNSSLAIYSFNTETTIGVLPPLHLIFPARAFVHILVIRLVIFGANG